MIGIYHSRDLDGWVSGAIIMEKHSDAIMIGYDYGDEFPWDIVNNHVIENRGKSMIMADISLPREDMIRLATLFYGNMVWIDHHKSAIEEMSTIRNEFQMVVDSNIAACEGVWKYLFPEEKIPRAVELLGMYDSFRHKGTIEEKDVLYFQYYARSVVSNVGSASVFLNSYYDAGRGIERGRHIYEYLCSDVLYKYDKMKYDVQFHHEGKILYFAMINGERINPANFGIDYHAQGYDGAGCYWYVKGKGWVFSLYNDNGEVDCSEICKKYGGGGHKGAAGFITQDIKPYL